MNLINQDQLTYIDNLLHSMVRGNFQIKCLIYMGNLLAIADDAFLYHADLSDKFNSDIMLGYKYISSSEKTPLEDYEVKDIISKFNYYKSKCNLNNHIFENDALREDPKYEEYSSLKASDGARFYFVNAKGCTPFIPVFSGLPILNKKDTVGMNMYSLGNNLILVVMNVYKKKFNITYNLYYKILDVNRPLRRF